LIHATACHDGSRELATIVAERGTIWQQKVDHNGSRKLVIMVAKSLS